MMAAENHYVYTGEGNPPADATHVSIHDSITVIPTHLFYEHPNIIELICHDRVRKVEEEAFKSCPRLKRVIMNGVEEAEAEAFSFCPAMEHVECQKLEIIREWGFHSCESLGSIDLPSARILEKEAFGDRMCNSTLSSVKFGKNLESIGQGAFLDNHNLRRIQIPLKKILFDYNGEYDVFMGCGEFREVDLVDQSTINDTVEALLLDEWRNDMNQEMDSINQILSNAHAGSENDDRVGEKARTLDEWTIRFLQKIIRYKVDHNRLLSLASAALAEVAPNEIIINSMLSWLQLPDYVFEGEGDSVATTPTLDRELWESIVQKGMLIRMKGDLREKEEKIVSLKSEIDILKKSNDDQANSIQRLEQRIAQLELQAAEATEAGGAPTQNDVGVMSNKRQRCSQLGVED